MKVGLIIDYFSIETGTGIARYNQELVSGLRRRGLEVKEIYASPPKIPMGDVFRHVIKQPYHVIKETGNCDLVHATAPITALSFPLIKKPKIITYHDLTSMLCNESGSRFHVRLTAPMFLRIGKYCDKIIAISTQTKKELIEYLKLPREKIAVINLGVGDNFKPLEKKENEYYVIGYVGAFAKRKRIDSLIRAFYYLKKNYPELNARLILCGKKELEFNRLDDLIRDLELTKYVEFKGFIPDNKLLEVYNSFDVFAFPSQWEGYGLPILEAQKCGVPVVIREDAHIPQETSKFCLKSKSDEDMADKIYELLINPSLKDEIVKKGIEYTKQFTWEKTVEKIVKVYEEILQVSKDAQ